MLNGILIVAAILIGGAWLSARHARRRDQDTHAMHARADGGGADGGGAE